VPSQFNISYFDLVIAKSEVPKILSIIQNNKHMIDFQPFELLASLLLTLMKNESISKLTDTLLVALKLKSLAAVNYSRFSFSALVFSRNRLRRIYGTSCDCAI
jgi:hypothetical protein